MSFDLAQLRAHVEAHGPIARVVVAEAKGSTPREVGAAMLIWDGGQSGTIGGGALELGATNTAYDCLTRRTDRVTRHPLGPALGQCCGGSATLITEVYDQTRLDTLDPTAPVVRRLEGPDALPLAARSALARARGEGVALAPQFNNGWMIEPILTPLYPVWIWGAGHVGRALVDVLSPLPDLDLTWIDTHPDRFPEDPAKGVTLLPTITPPALVAHAPAEAHHLILTYSHALDLELCHALLGHRFASLGLIGSATKWARFQNRLGDLGHTDSRIAAITCPIGDPDLGKSPQAIALGVATSLLGATRRCAALPQKKDRPA